MAECFRLMQEDTIIYSLIERAQFQRNDWVYQADGVAVPASCSRPSASNGSASDEHQGVRMNMLLKFWPSKKPGRTHSRIKLVLTC